MPMPGVMPGTIPTTWRPDLQTNSIGNNAPSAIQQPALERLVNLAGGARNLTDLIDRFRARLAGAPSVNNPPTPSLSDKPSDPLPAGMNELLTLLEDKQEATYAELLEIAGRF